MSIIERIKRKIQFDIHKRKLRKQGNYIVGHIDLDSQFEGKNKCLQDSVILDSRLGFATYVGQGSRILHARIGRYCCIGRNLDIVFAQHPLYNCVSMHPAFYSRSNFPGGYVCEEKFKLFRFLYEDVTVEIGHDVWIGDNVTIVGGGRSETGLFWRPALS